VIWLKRLLPLFVIALGYGGYSIWDKWYTERENRDESEIAKVTAQVWIATAKYRNDPARYMQFRDSLLKATGVPRDRVMKFLERREGEPEDLLPFAMKVQNLVDSLYKIEDSIALIEVKRVEDSLKIAAPNQPRPKASDGLPAKPRVIESNDE